VLDYERLKNLVALTLAAAYFAAVWLGEKLQLNGTGATRGKTRQIGFFGIPEFALLVRYPMVFASCFHAFGAWASPNTSFEIGHQIFEPQLCLSPVTIKLGECPVCCSGCARIGLVVAYIFMYHWGLLVRASSIFVGRCTASYNLFLTSYIVFGILDG